jgi:hypothetical protein
MLGLLALRRDMLVLILFVLAIGSITANIIVTLVNVSLRLLEKPSETRIQFGGSVDISKGRLNLLDYIYFASYLISFITAWIATATLLHHYSHRIGKLKYWLIASVPMIIFAAHAVCVCAGGVTILLFATILVYITYTLFYMMINSAVYMMRIVIK